jgi:hypothetical protein
LVPYLEKLVSLTFLWKKGKTFLVSEILQVYITILHFIVEKDEKIAKENRKIILNLKNIINHPSTTGLIMGLHEDPDYISPRERIRRFKVKSRYQAQQELKNQNKVIHKFDNS